MVYFCWSNETSKEKNIMYGSMNGVMDSIIIGSLKKRNCQPAGGDIYFFFEEYDSHNYCVAI